MLTADDVLNARFTSTWFRDGYDQAEVDDFLDQVVQRLRTRESGPDLDTLPRPGFRRTRFRWGYDIEQVDRLLREIHDTRA